MPRFRDEPGIVKVNKSCADVMERLIHDQVFTINSSWERNIELGKASKESGVFDCLYRPGEAVLVRRKSFRKVWENRFHVYLKIL
jgi:hypothetical protein